MWPGGHTGALQRPPRPLGGGGGLTFFLRTAFRARKPVSSAWAFDLVACGGASWMSFWCRRVRQELHHHVAPLALFAPPQEAPNTPHNPPPPPTPLPQLPPQPLHYQGSHQLPRAMAKQRPSLSPLSATHRPPPRPLTPLLPPMFGGGIWWW
jgi:hypothetical protein